MKLEIVSAERDSAILIGDEDHNDIAEFYHNEHATVGQSYETALALAAKLVAAPNNIIAFGFGLYGVDIGTLGDIPAVFIIPNKKPGPVGDKIPLELQGPLELEKLPDDWIALTFPSRERCKEVADALVGSKMEKWTNG